MTSATARLTSTDVSGGSLSARGLGRPDD